jgi:hypothetical protein
VFWTRKWALAYGRARPFETNGFVWFMPGFEASGAATRSNAWCPLRLRLPVRKSSRSHIYGFRPCPVFALA